MIVAWHEVPGTAPPQKRRPVGYGMIRAGVRTDSKRLEGGNLARMRYRFSLRLEKQRGECSIKMVVDGHR